MRKVLLFPFLLFLGLKIFACHTTSIDNVTIVNNANGTKTFTIDFTINVGAMDGTSYGFALIFANSTTTAPVVLTSPAFTPTVTKAGGYVLNGYTGTGIGTGTAVNYFSSRYSNRTDVLTYESSDFMYGFGTVDYSSTITVTIDGCVEFIDLDGDFRSNGTAVVNSGCTNQYSTNLNCCTPTASNLNPTVCFGDNFVYNGTTYNAANPTGIETLLNNSGCDSFVTVNITELSEITTVLDTMVCSGNAVTINGITYDSLNSTGSQVLTSITGCDSTLNVTLSFHSNVTTKFDTTICNGSSVVLFGATYDSANSSGSHLLTSSIGCDSTVLVNVLFQSTILASFDTSICEGSSFTKAGVVYDSTNMMGTSLLVSQAGCDSLLKVNINQLYPEWQTNLDTSICEGEQLSIHGANFDISKTNGQIVLMSQNQCDSVIQVNVQIKSSPSIFLQASAETICHNEQSTLTVMGAKNYLWNDNSVDSVRDVNNGQSETFTVFGYNSLGCADSASVRINVEGCYDLYLPNAFSPNGDGQNDVYRVHTNATEIDFLIFDRWGELVFETKDPSQSWDGTVNGQLREPSVFTYLLRLHMFDGSTELSRGNITLVR